MYVVNNAANRKVIPSGHSDTPAELVNGIRIRYSVQLTHKDWRIRHGHRWKLIPIGMVTVVIVQQESATLVGLTPFCGFIPAIPIDRPTFVFINPRLFAKYHFRCVAVVVNNVGLRSSSITTTWRIMQMKCCILNVKYSPDLGPGSLIFSKEFRHFN